MGNNKKRKSAATVGAVTLAAALALTGTYAWRSISQQAVNKKVVNANPGGRLHDDWNGTIKSVYVENFADQTVVKEEGTYKTAEDKDAAPIFVRVRMQEYMEFGPDAGGKKGDPTRDAVSVAKGKSIDKESEWNVHIPGSGDDPFHKYWNWETGESAGAVAYMPTFNRNKDSLTADINGTYNGKDGTYEHFDDFIAWKLNGENDANDATENVGVKTAKTYYDIDDNDKDEGPDQPGNGGEKNVNYAEVEEKHTTKQTLETKQVMTMKEWQDAGYPIGNYWVWDSDGWAYWAAPLEPGTATGLLLSKVTSNSDQLKDKCYYAINVVGEFASAGDWGEEADAQTNKEATGFYVNGITDDALDLLDRIITIQYE